jgi:hypothetical protein
LGLDEERCLVLHLLRVLRRQVVRLGEVFVKIVKFPCILIEAGEPPPRQPTVARHRHPAVLQIPLLPNISKYCTVRREFACPSLKE